MSNRVCINRLRFGASQLTTAVTYLESRDDLMQDLFNALFNICTAEASAPPPNDAQLSGFARAARQLNRSGDISRPDGKLPSSDKSDEQARDQSSNSYSAMTKIVHDGPEPPLNLLDDKSSRGSKNGMQFGYYGWAQKSAQRL